MTETWRNRLMLTIAIALAAIYLFPLYWMYVTALKTGSAMFATPPSFWPSDPQWGTYVYVWESRNLARYMWNSLIIAFGAVALITVLARAAPMCLPVIAMAGSMSGFSSSSCCRFCRHR
jgi:multiple sugar transport system permease protein